MAALRFVISGFVQGVGYRYFALRRASKLGLVGFVRNLPDGSVEVVAAGPDAALGQLEAGLRQGPTSARVDSVERSQTAPPGGSGFTIR